MKSFEKYFPLYKRVLENHEKNHPYWQIEELVSLIKWSLKSLRHCLEDPCEPKITWNNPFVELHYPIGWNWRPNYSDKACPPGGHIFGKIASRNTATKKLAVKTLSQIMARHINAVTLANATNWVWYQKNRNYYLPRLPMELAQGLAAIKSKQKRRSHFNEIVRPFSLGAGRIDLNPAKLKSDARVLQKVRRELVENNRQMDIPPVTISGDVNGHKFEAYLVFEIHPLIADYDLKKAYHPVVVGLGFATRMIDDQIVEDGPADWPKSDQQDFWDGLLQEMDKMVGLLIPQDKSGDSITLDVNSKLKIPAVWWQPENRSATIKLAADILGHMGEITQLEVDSTKTINGMSEGHKLCPICRWTHDDSFAWIKTDAVEINLFSGVLPEIVAAVHRAHEKGQKGLSTKNDELVKICGGYKNPCKAFQDKNRRKDYRALFYTRAKGFISLRGALGLGSQ